MLKRCAFVLAAFVLSSSAVLASDNISARVNGNSYQCSDGDNISITVNGNTYQCGGAAQTVRYCGCHLYDVGGIGPADYRYQVYFFTLDVATGRSVRGGRVPGTPSFAQSDLDGCNNSLNDYQVCRILGNQ